MSEQSNGSSNYQIWDHLGRAALGFALGLGFYWHANPTWWMFYVFAAICAAGGLKRLGHALVTFVRLLLKQRSMRKYQAQGKDQKADKTAQTSDLRERGLIK